jgi:hypothetical protein
MARTVAGARSEMDEHELHDHCREQKFRVKCRNFTNFYRSKVQLIVSVKKSTLNGRFVFTIRTSIFEPRPILLLLHKENWACIHFR